mmetsp:Transcript_72991/g.191332  ORF Transcript_72991/g.191332 Transcript_72991/m.191332 type:complete len:259 (-) Transcript_72991:356-1132(-)
MTASHALTKFPVLSHVAVSAPATCVGGWKSRSSLTALMLGGPGLSQISSLLYTDHRSQPKMLAPCDSWFRIRDSSMPLGIMTEKQKSEKGSSVVVVVVSVVVVFVDVDVQVSASFMDSAISRSTSAASPPATSRSVLAAVAPSRQRRKSATVRNRLKAAAFGSWQDHQPAGGMHCSSARMPYSSLCTTPSTSTRHCSRNLSSSPGQLPPGQRYLRPSSFPAHCPEPSPYMPMPMPRAATALRESTSRDLRRPSWQLLT